MSKIVTYLSFPKKDRVIKELVTCVFHKEISLKLHYATPNIQGDIIR